MAREGSNTIVIRIMDGQGGGGFMNEAKHFAIKASNGESIPISDDWKAKKGFDYNDVKTIPVSPFNPNQPSVLFNAVITSHHSLYHEGSHLVSGREQCWKDIPITPSFHYHH